MTPSRPLVVTWIIASVSHLAPRCVPPVPVHRSPLVPLPLHQPLWIGQWTPVNGPSCVELCMFAFVTNHSYSIS